MATRMTEDILEELYESFPGNPDHKRSEREIIVQGFCEREADTLRSKSFADN